MLSIQRVAVLGPRAAYRDRSRIVIRRLNSKWPLKKKCYQGCFKRFSGFSLAHRKWQVVPEGSVGKRP